MTAQGDVSQRIEGLHADADLYLVKPVHFDELLAAVQKAARALKADTLDGRWMVDPSAWTLSAPAGEPVPLTGRELALLTVFIERSGITVDRHSLIQALGGDPSSFDSRRLEVSVRRLRNKVLKTAGVPLPLKTVYGQGFVFTAGLGRSG